MNFEHFPNPIIETLWWKDRYYLRSKGDAVEGERDRSRPQTPILGYQVPNSYFLSARSISLFRFLSGTFVMDWLE